LVWGALAILGGIGGAFAAPYLIRRQATPERLRSKESNEKERRSGLETERGKGVFETDNTRVQFRRPEKSSDGEKGTDPSDPNAPLH